MLCLVPCAYLNADWYLQSFCDGRFTRLSGLGLDSRYPFSHAADAWGKAGIRGIFVTQSNDFALGLPLLQVTHPQQKKTGYLPPPPSRGFPLSLPITPPSYPGDVGLAWVSSVTFP